MTHNANSIRKSSGCASLVHSGRVLLLVLIIGLIHLGQQQAVNSADQGSAGDVDLRVIQQLDPRAETLGVSTGHGTDVLDDSGQFLFRVLQTSPEGDQQIGFSGPTNILMALDNEQRILKLQVLSSRDTREHVLQVRNDPEFFNRFVGKTATDLRASGRIDGVSGATLTSMAIAEAIRVRLGAMPRGGSLKFPDPPDFDRVQELFPTAAVVDRQDEQSSIWIVKDSAGREVGRFLRTSPAADNIIGYQGPTDSLVTLNADGIVDKIWVNRSYENEPYYHYLNEDWSFPEARNGKSLPELARTRFEDLGIEGVSGATMTSQAVLRGVLEAARVDQERLNTPADPEGEAAVHGPVWQVRDLGTAGVVLAGIVLGLTRLRGNRGLRLAYQFIVIGYLGLMNGDLLSQAMFFGWAQNGIPWKKTLGLCLLTAAGILLPIGTGQNVYCSHICPHGAVQQLVKNRLPWRWPVPRPVHRFLSLLPGLLVTWCVAVVLLRLPFSLVDIEPFDAWIIRIAGWGTLSVAIIGLLFSLLVPMGYCRYGCPTGAFLGYLRRHRRSDRVTIADALAVIVAISAAVVLLF